MRRHSHIKPDGADLEPAELDLEPSADGAEAHQHHAGGRASWLSRSYYVLHHGGNWMLSWHGPWCRCDMKAAGWRFVAERGYAAGLGFELSWVARAPVER